MKMAAHSEYNISWAGIVMIVMRILWIIMISIMTLLKMMMMMMMPHCVLKETSIGPVGLSPSHE